MKTVDKCNKLLEILFPGQIELQERWWLSPNRAFDNKTPEQMLDENPGRVVQYLLGQFNGDYS